MHEVYDERKSIEQLALGIDGAFFILRKDGSSEWNFTGHYPSLNAKLKALEGDSSKNVKVRRQIYVC
jgi:hypothetical protein